jgi:APA family basic amino acid/polyamine antiporter
MFGFLLISTVSVMILAGPRALQMIGQDIQVFHLLSKTNKNGVPFIAIFTQLAITLFLIITSSFEEIILFSGILLALNSLVTVFADHTSNFTMPFYPVRVIVYSSIIGITLFYLIFERPVQVFSSAVLIAVGFVLFILDNRSR